MQTGHMTTSTEGFQVDFSGCTLTRGKVTVIGDHVEIRFDLRGPDATVRFPKDHVAVLAVGGEEKLTSVGGYGGDGAPGSCFFEWQMLHGGAEAIRVCYVEGGSLLAEERLLLTA